MGPWNVARSPASVMLMIEFGHARAIGAAALLRDTHLSLKQLEDPDFTVTAAQELAVAASLLQQCRHEPDLGLKLGLSYRLSAYGLLGYGLLSSATGLEAIALAKRYLALTYTYVGLTFGRDEDGLDEVSFNAAPELTPDLKRFFVGRAMGATSRVMRDVIGSDFRITSFRTTHAPGDRKQVFGARIMHGQAVDAFTVDHAYLARPLPQANAATAAMCERMCAELLARRKTRLDMASFLTDYLATHAFERPPQLHDIAGLLNTSERTLKRRLREEGASFRAISTAARSSRAQALVAEGRLSMGQIAEELGFSDLSSFSQSYKRWTGVAPSLSQRKTE